MPFPRPAPNAGGAGITTMPNYLLWVEGRERGRRPRACSAARLPIEVIEYDDRSTAEESVRAVERLATQDKVDFILPPWGTGFNLASAPAFRPLRLPAARRYRRHRHGARPRQALEEQLLDARRRPRLCRGACVASRQGARRRHHQQQGRHASVADGFGIDLVHGATPAFDEGRLRAGLRQDLSARHVGLRADHQRGRRAGRRYLRRLLLSAGYLRADPAVRGRQFQSQGVLPRRRHRLPDLSGDCQRGKPNGVMGVGGIDPDSEATCRLLRSATPRSTARRPTAGPARSPMRASQMLQQAIERIGDLDREAVSAELSNGDLRHHPRQGQAGGQPAAHALDGGPVAERPVRRLVAPDRRRRPRASRPAPVASPHAHPPPEGEEQPV